MKEVPIKNVMESFEYLKDFVSDEQLKAFNLACLGLEYPFFRARLFALAQRIKDMPKTGTNFFPGANGIAYLHYFLDDYHFYISMKDGLEDGEGQIQAIGCTDWHNGRFVPRPDYINLRELIAMGAQLDLYWNPMPLKEVKAS